jgi:hypothetical protein
LGDVSLALRHLFCFAQKEALARLRVCVFKCARSLSQCAVISFCYTFDLVSVCFGVLFRCFVVFVCIVSSGCFWKEEGNTSVEMSEDLGNRPGTLLLFSIFLL